MTFDLTGVGEPLKIEAALVAGEMFEALGARAALGRPLTKSDDVPGGERVVALSYGFWQSQFAGDRGILGTAITLGGVPYTVAGVLTPEFRLPDIAAGVYTPIEVAYPMAAQARGAHMLRAVVRLAPGVSPAAARGDLDAAMKRLAVEHPDEDKYLRPDFVPLLDGIVGESKRPLWILAGAVGLVLLIACANLANLLLARASSRSAELAVRTALGASRGRLMGQILTESLLLAVIGGACGVLLASWGTQLLLAAMPDVLPRLDGVGIDGRVVAVHAACCRFSPESPSAFSRPGRPRAGASLSASRDPAARPDRRPAGCATRSWWPRSRWRWCSSSRPGSSSTLCGA